MIEKFATFTQSTKIKKDNLKSCLLKFVKRSNKRIPRSSILQKLKSITGENKIWLRATGSTLISQVIDSFVVLFIAFKIGADWDLLSNLVFSLKSNIRFNRIKGNENDGIDNDDDGKIDGKSEIWSTSNSGTVISLNYRF